MVFVMLWLVCLLVGFSDANDMKQNYRKVLKHMDNLEKILAHQAKIIEVQQQKIINHEQVLSKILQSDVGLKEQAKTTSENVEKRLTASQQTPVAFSAYKNHFINSLVPNAVIPFEMITTNEGSAFDGNVFTCPVAGLYLFLWNIMVDNGYSTQVQLIVNGVVRRWSYAYSTGTETYANAANHDIVHLAEGDKVWIANERGAGEIHPHHNTFTGVLLFRY